ncbi:MAG: Tfp pilus assembly protein PilZ [Pseudohongiellaceae bacterium]|jgi:Tfp pilus assembly protein PilZ
MPFLKNGGLFLPVAAAPQIQRQSRSTFKFQGSVCLLLKLLDDSQRHFCITTIVWIMPAVIRGDRCKGIGLHFDRSDSQIRILIESRLGNYENALSKSQTL